MIKNTSNYDNGNLFRSDDYLKNQDEARLGYILMEEKTEKPLQSILKLH